MIELWKGHEQYDSILLLSPETSELHWILTESLCGPLYCMRFIIPGTLSTYNLFSISYLMHTYQSEMKTPPPPQFLKADFLDIDSFHTTYIF